MNTHRKRDLSIELGVGADNARRLAVMMADANRPGHARRMHKIANYLQTLHTLLDVDGEIPADPPLKLLPQTNVRRLGS